MPIQRTIEPDFVGDPVCSYLRGPSEQYTDVDERKSEWLKEGYDFIVDKPAMIVDPVDAVVSLPFFEGCNYELRTQAGRLLRKGVVQDVAFVTLEFQIGAVLFIKPDLVDPLKRSVIDAFNNANILNDDVNQIETDLLRQGVNMDDYQVALYFNLKKKGIEYKRVNRQALIDQIKQQVDESGNQLFNLTINDGGHFYCSLPDNVEPDEHIIIGDPDDPVSDIESHEKERQKECADLVVTEHRIGTAFQYREWKTEMEMKTIRIGKCRLMKTKLPVLYHRTAKQALVGYVLSEADLKKYMKRSFEDCLKSAAIVTGVLAIVTGGMGLAAAAAAFGTALQTCLEKKVETVVICLFSRLKLVKEPGDWKHGA